MWSDHWGLLLGCQGQPGIAGVSVSIMYMSSAQWSAPSSHYIPCTNNSRMTSDYLNDSQNYILVGSHVMKQRHLLIIIDLKGMSYKKRGL